jgi:transposase
MCPRGGSDRFCDEIRAFNADRHRAGGHRPAPSSWCVRACSRRGRRAHVTRPAGGSTLARMTPREQRYPSDTSDEQWTLIEPLLPDARTGGRPEETPAPGRGGRDPLRRADRVRLAAAPSGLPALAPARPGHHDPGHRTAHRAQAHRPARLRRHPTPLGRRAHLRLAHRPPPPRAGLRTPPRPLRSHDPLGSDRHHHPPGRPRQLGDPAAEARLHTLNTIFSNTL